MIDICPTVTAYDLTAYSVQLRRLTSFAERIHIDLMDGTFAPTVSPGPGDIWLPHGPLVDIHLMYQKPMEVLDQLVKLKPHMVIIHNEAEVHHMHFAAELHKHGIKTGLAVLQDTPVEYTFQILHSFDQLLIFSGNLGHHGGTADVSLLSKVAPARDHHPDIEIAWDGGVSEQNAVQLYKGGVDVLNVGGYIQNSSDPAHAYATLKSIVEQQI